MVELGDVVQVVDENCGHFGCVGVVERFCNILGATVVVRFDGENKRWRTVDEWVPYAEAQLKKVVV